MFFEINFTKIGDDLQPKQPFVCSIESSTHQRTGRGAWGGCGPPCRKKISIIRAKLIYRSGKDTVKNIL